MYETAAAVLRLVMADALQGLMDVSTAIGVLVLILHGAYAPLLDIPAAPEAEQRSTLPVSTRLVERLIDC